MALTIAAPDDRHADGEELDPHLAGNGEILRAGAAERRGGQDAGAERADDAADAVDAEDIEAVVVAHGRLHHRDEEVADDAGDGTEDDRADGPDRSRRPA